MGGKNKTGGVQNVGCTVTDCIYHSQQDRCCARGITVENKSAQSKAETFCSTFENRAEN